MLICEEYNNHSSPETVRLCFARLGDLLGVDEVAGAPVALHEPPGSRHVHRVPRVPIYMVIWMIFKPKVFDYLKISVLMVNQFPSQTHEAHQLPTPRSNRIKIKRKKNIMLFLRHYFLPLGENRIIKSMLS